MTTIGGGRFGERDDCGGGLDGGVKVGGGGVFSIVVRIVRYRRLGHCCVEVEGGIWKGKRKRRKKKDGKVSKRLGGRL